jgi:glycosyltransferase involved in cell wall biosynthesis
MNTLLAISAGADRLDTAEMERREAADLMPRASLLERRLDAELLYERFPACTPGHRRFLYRFLPRGVPQVLEAFLLRNRYDALVTWAESISLPLALLLKLTGSRVPHVAVFSSITQRKKALVLRAVQSHISRMVINSQAQAEFAVRELGVPAEKVSTLTWTVDQRFWRPMPGPTDMISTSGRELRDYATLIRALRDLEVRCHIAAKLVPWKRDAWVEEVKTEEPLPPHLTIGYNESITEVRSWYGRSRFIVLPLLRADYELGSTVILEAMAMGKAVICTRINGQRDLLTEGKTGIYVPPNDPVALREAIRTLWNDPGLAEEMGRAARREVEEKYGLDEWVERMRQVVVESIERVSAGEKI